MKMKKAVHYSILNILVLVGMAAAVNSCKEEDDTLRLSQLFRPTSIDFDIGETETVIMWNRSLFTLPGEVEYILEVSDDSATFEPVAFTTTTEESTWTITSADILVRKPYYCRIKATGKEGVKDSEWVVSDAFGLTGEQIFLPLEESDIIDNAVILSWNTTPDEITKIVVYEDGMFLLEVMVDGDDNLAAEKLVEGLTGSTEYIAEIFAGAQSKGLIQFTTKQSLEGDNIIDLRGITDRPEVLLDTLPQIASGSIVVLRRGLTYAISSGYSVDRSVTILSGAAFNPEFAAVYFTGDLNFASVAIDSVVFKDLHLYGDNFSGRYLFNANSTATVSKLKFESCRIRVFRGMLRMRGGVTVTNYSVNNCLIDSLREYAVVDVSDASSTVQNVLITNSTISHARKVIDNGSNGSNSITIQNCTFYKAPRGGDVTAMAGDYFIFYGGSHDVTLPIQFNNCILGPGWDDGNGPHVNGWSAGASTTINVTNTYSTSDFISNNPATQLTGLNASYGKLSTVLFKDPENGDFTIMDDGFAGKDISGDPRWRP